MPAPKAVSLLLVTGLSCLVLSLGGCGNKQTGFPQMPPQDVAVVTLKNQPVTLTRELPGRTSAYLVAEVRPQVTGIVKRRLFTEGGQVKTGEVLYELDDAVYRAAYDSAQANLRRAQATLEAARLGAARSTELAKIDAVSTQDNETAQAAFHQAEADVASARAQLQSAKVNLDYTRITSPIGGRIGKSTVTAGALVTANQDQALAVVQQLDPIYVDVTQSSSEWLQLKREIDAGRMRAGGAGTRARIVLEDGSDYEREGRLQFTDVSVDGSTGSFLLRVLVPNPNRVLMPGMYVRAIVDEGTLSKAVLVPQQGVTRTPRGDASALVVVDGKAATRAVKVSRTIGSQWLVEEGLQAGDRVIVEGVQKAQPGMPVKAVEQGEAVAATQSSQPARVARSSK